MAITGHRSTDAVRTYKKISTVQEASKIIQQTKQILEVKDEDEQPPKKLKVDKDNNTVYNFSGCTVTTRAYVIHAEYVSWEYM